MFSEAVLEHFRNPRNTGALETPAVTVEVSNPVCGDVLQLFAKVQGNRFERVTFLCRGCTTAIACGSWLTEKLTGMAFTQAARLSSETISSELGGLPPTTVHGAELALDALRSLLQKLQSQRGPG